MCITLRPTVIYFFGQLQTQNRPFRVPGMPSAFQPCAGFCAAITRSNSPRTRVSPSQGPETQSAFIGTHDEMLSVAVSVHNPDRSPFNI